MDQNKTKKKKKKKEPWLKKRHAVITKIAKGVCWPAVTKKYNIEIEKFKEQGDRQYLILANHQTGFDQFFVGYMFKGPIYYIASEDIFSMGFVSDLLRFAVNPIPIKKQATDVSAVLNCLRVAREGGTIALFPEGNRTYSGHTEYINPAIAMLVKKLGLPVVFVKIEGGYGVAPRWGDESRKGTKMRSYVSRVMEPEEFKTLSDSEMMDIINKELYVDETKIVGEYSHKRLAEYLERAIYYCPKCNALSTFESHGDEIECKKCGMKAQYLPNKELRGINCELPYKFIADWYEDQLKFVGALDLASFGDEPIYVENGAIDEVIVYKNKKKLYHDVKIYLYGDKIVVKGGEEYIFPLGEIRAITVCGKNKLNLYFGDKVYQITGGERFNALKYVNLTFRYRNIKKAEKGEDYEQFLGL